MTDVSLAGTERPQFVIDRVWSFQQNYSQYGDPSRMCGWGRGIYVQQAGETPFTWFAWINMLGTLNVLIDSVKPTDEEFQLVLGSDEDGKDAEWFAVYLHQEGSWQLLNANHAAYFVRMDAETDLKKAIASLGRYPFFRKLEVVETFKSIS